MSNISINGRYSFNTDNSLYTLSLFQGNTLDKKVAKDIVTLRDACFEKGHVCSAVWFKNANVDALVKNIDNLHWDEFKKYYVSYNHEQLASAEDAENGVRIWYPKVHTGPYIYVTNNRAGIQFAYQVVGQHAKRIDTPPVYGYQLGQYWGYVEKLDAKGVISEWTYGYARDIR